MKIAIHHSPISYSSRWIEYCQSSNIKYKIVNCYSNDIIKSLEDCDILMWHFYHKSSRDFVFAKQLMFAVQASGKKVFPDFNSSWHFDDKVGQKYLFEAIGAPLIPSYVFYSKSEAIQWVNGTTFPKVFKLRRGSGSANVQLIKTRKHAIRIINKAFNSGFRQYNAWGGLRERFRLFAIGKSNVKDLFEGVGRFFLRTDFEKIAGNEKGYVYFQDFIEGCAFDIRVTVINDKCYAFKRLTREGDFRASGSHSEIYSSDGIPLEMIKIAFKISNTLKLQSAAFDFLLSDNKVPLITEVCYAFGWDDGDCYGYWDSELNWHEGDFNPFGYMIENLIREMEKGNINI